MSASAATVSMSRWSMTATSPGCSRLVRFLVRESTRATPTTPSAVGWWVRERRRGRRIAAQCSTPDPADRSGRDLRDLRGGALAQLLGVRPGRAGVLRAGEHPGQLGHPLVVVQRADAALGDGAVVGLDDHEVAVGEGGDLGEGGGDDPL